MAALLTGLSQGVRNWVQKPGLALLVILVLTLGIGATSAIVTVVHAVLLHPGPFPSPDQLVIVWEKKKDSGEGLVASYPNFRDWKARSHVFKNMACERDWQATLRMDSGPMRLRGVEISKDFARVIGLGPYLGRLASDEDFRPDAPAVVVLSYGFWQRQFGGESGLVGQTINVDGSPRTVIGVLPPHMTVDEPLAGYNAEIFAPLDTRAPWFTRGNRFLRVIGRMRPGMTKDDAASEIAELAEGLATEYPKANKGWTAHVETVRELMVGEVRGALLMLLGAAGFVLLMACINLANLFAVEIGRRRQEFAIRMAMGAGRARLAWQLLVESIPLIGAGGLGGLVLTYWATGAFEAMLPDSIVGTLGSGTTGSMIVVTTLVSALTIILVQLAPVMEVSSVSRHELLAEGAPCAGISRRSQRVRSVLVVMEVAISLLLLIGAGLLIKSLVLLSRVDPGFDHQNILTAEVALPFHKFNKPEQTRRFLGDIFRSLDRDPRVRSVAVANYLPLQGGHFKTHLGGDGEVRRDMQIDLRGVSPRYFSTMGIPLLGGRDFCNDDLQGNIKAVILCEAMADRLWPGQDPIGKQLVIKWGEEVPREVVGVVGNVMNEKIGGPLSSIVYLPYVELPVWTMNFLVGTVELPLALAKDVRSLLRSSDQDIVILNIGTMERLVEAALAKPRVHALFLFSFAVVGFVLAVAGVYGVTSFTVALRTREFAVRMALGASRRDILTAALLQSLWMVGGGVLLGLGGAYLLTSFLTTFLFEVGTLDPLTFAAAATSLGSVSLLAILFSTRSATKVNPAETLKGR